ncbi:pyrroloquinoline quinone biosynthesis peptide chaperone PqqD [Streptomyces sp. NPDC002845]
MPSTRPTRSESTSPARSEERRPAGERGAAVTSSSRPKPAPHTRMRWDAARGQHVLLGPESVVALNHTGAEILALCDGRRTVAEIVATLRERYDRVADDEIRHFLARLAAKRYVVTDDG